MSISNLSNDRGGIGPLNGRPTFLRDEGTPTLLSAVTRYDGTVASGAGDDNSKLFDGGDPGNGIDYRSIAAALLARLDALRDRFDAKVDASSSGATDASQARRTLGGGGAHKGWWHHGQWYSTSATAGGGSGSSSSSSNATTTTPPAPAPAPPPTLSSPTSTNTNTNTSSNTQAPQTGNPSNPAPNSSAPPAPTTPSAPPPTVGSGPLTPSGSINLGDGAATISNLAITGDTGIVASNAKNVTTLNVNNVTIRSRNYGIYLGSCDKLNLSNVDIACDATGGDSYSIRGNIRNLVSSDSTYRAGIKAFRIYGLEGGSSTRDTYTGDRLMLGGGYANEWGDAAPFHNFTFRDGSINVNSVELYNDTNNVVFDNMDFSGTGHISIQAGAHNITFRNCTNLPEIRLYDTSGHWTPLPADSSRNISVE